MSILQDTLNFISNRLTAKDSNEVLVKSNIADHTIALPEGVKLESLERFKPGRTRFRGEFRTNHIASFIKCVKEQAGSTFVNAENLSAVHIHNLGTVDKPGHCDHRAVLHMERKAEYDAMCSMAGKPFDQKDFAQWMSEFASNLTAVSASGEVMAISKAIAGIRSIDVEAVAKHSSTVKNIGYEKSTFESIEATSLHELPAKLTFSCSPYSGFSNRDFTLLINYGVNNPVRLSYKIERWEAINQELSEEFRDILEGMLGSDILIGSFDTRSMLV